MNLFHISAECYPAAKAGGLGDVVGALPKVQNSGHDSVTVVMPAYETKWIQSAPRTPIFEGTAPLRDGSFGFRIDEVSADVLGFRLLLVHIPGRTDRPGVYIDPWSGAAYWDERERFLCFQVAFLEWLVRTPAERAAPTVLHCHDHHAALVPFLASRCQRFSPLRNLPTVLTIHNGEYQGDYDMSFHVNLPAFPAAEIGLLEWNGSFNSLACGIKCAWRVTTVSPGYLDELMVSCAGLESLLRHERAKAVGILNGIDLEVWDPAHDPMLVRTYGPGDHAVGKAANKKALQEFFNLRVDRPLFAFIGRLVREKGADLLPHLIRRAAEEDLPASFIVLGTGERQLHEVFSQLQGDCFGWFDSRLEYNERLAHLIYAGSDYLLMPSRVEPCGLNQMYAMRYGTIPVVRAVGGLRDTVPPLNGITDRIREGLKADVPPPVSTSISSSTPTDPEPDGADGWGRGFAFESFSVDAIWNCILEAVFYNGMGHHAQLHRSRLMGIDFSWERSASTYGRLYSELLSIAETQGKSA